MFGQAPVIPSELPPIPSIPGYVTEASCDARVAEGTASVASGARTIAIGVGLAGLVIGYLVGKAMK